MWTSQPRAFREQQLGKNNFHLPSFRPILSSALPYTAFAPTVFEFDTTKIEYCPDELICDENHLRMRELIKYSVFICILSLYTLGSGVTGNNYVLWTCDNVEHT